MSCHGIREFVGILSGAVRLGTISVPTRCYEIAGECHCISGCCEMGAISMRKWCYVTGSGICRYAVLNDGSGGVCISLYITGSPYQSMLYVHWRQTWKCFV